MLAHLLLAAAPNGLSGNPPHDLARLQLTNKVIVLVKDTYSEPKRIMPREMFRAALRQLGKDFPGVTVVTPDNEVRVTYRGETRSFDTGTIDSLWKMSFTLRDAATLIAKKLPEGENSRRMEYSLIRGMLFALDSRCAFFEAGETVPPAPKGVCTFASPDGEKLRVPCNATTTP